MKAWIPRNLRDDGMISMDEAPSYASFVQQYVLLSDHKQALAEKELALAQANRHKEQLFAKVAEKDEQLKEHGRVMAELYHYKERYESLCKTMNPVMEEILNKSAEKDRRIEQLQQEAQIHAQEARTANRTIAEIYQVVSGKTGEPGNWHGAEPVKRFMAQAVRFAKNVSRNGRWQENEWDEAQAFLKEYNGEVSDETI